jgi:hypothetical protein
MVLPMLLRLRIYGVIKVGVEFLKKLFTGNQASLPLSA